MADHDVYFSIPERELGRADVEFRVKRDGGAFGRLRVSAGSLVWVPVNKQYGYKLGWKQLDKLAQEHGEEERE
jgi:hypothetical protein